MAMAWTVATPRELRYLTGLAFSCPPGLVRVNKDAPIAPSAAPMAAAVTSVAEGNRVVLKSCVASALSDSAAAIATACQIAPRRPYENPNGMNSAMFASTSRGRSAGSVNGIGCTRSHCGREVNPDDGKLIAQTTGIHHTHNGTSRGRIIDSDASKDEAYRTYSFFTDGSGRPDQRNS